MIYFAQAQNGLIKIGFAESVVGRIGKLASDVDQKVRLLSAARGGRSEEAALHLRFAHARVRGDDRRFGKEWYLPIVDLVAHIASLPPAPADLLSAERVAMGRLRTEIGKRGLTVNQATKILRTSTGNLSRLLTGHHLPNLELAARIEDLFGIPMRDWITERAPDEAAVAT